MSEAAQKSLFQSFTQADASTTRRFGGTGLGLAICRKLVELMGGAIGVNSALGIGSTFWFDLPFAVPSTAGAAAGDKPVAPLPASYFSGSASSVGPIETCVLLAEDNQINQLVAVKQLNKIGYPNVEVAVNGLEALGKWHEKRHAIILMDCQMPEMDGYTATKKIRELEKASGLPASWIIAMTASAMLGDRDVCLAAGMDDYISKPVNREDLLAALERAQVGLKARGVQSAALVAG